MTHRDEASTAPRLVLTPAAVECLRELVEQSGDAGSRVRVDAEDSDTGITFSLRIESESGPQDVELDFLDVTVVLAPYADQQLRGCEMDFRSDPEGEYFVVRAGN